MDPILFRRHLRKIVSNTTKATAIVGTALLMNCGPDIKKPAPTYCPASKISCGGGGNPEVVKHQIKVEASEPDPMPLERCQELCRTEATKLCLHGNPRESVTLTIKSGEKDCVRYTAGAKKERMIECAYEARKSCVVAGRRPAGLEAQEAASVTFTTPEEEAGAFFAELAYLEDAAVTAFEYLVKELQAYDAPAALLELATNAIQEEREHVVLMTALAKRYGAAPKAASAAPFRLRPLAEIAIENAREGCVRESFGSVLGFWQASHSEDPAVRAVMERIAHEESNHGALSWAIDEWARPQLNERELEAYHQAHQEAITGIQAEILDEPSEAMRRIAGMPTVAQAQHLFQQLIA